ncbi:transposase [Methylolobus aquaticus]
MSYLGMSRSMILPGRPGRGSENKIPFVPAVETNAQGHPLFIKLRPTPFTKTAWAAWSEASLNPDSYVVSDGLGAFRGITGNVTCHHRIIVGSGRAAVQRVDFH